MSWFFFANKTTFKPVVAHGKERGKKKMDILVTSAIDFEETIKVIADNAFKQTSDPLFICMEINTNYINSLNLNLPLFCYNIGRFLFINTIQYFFIYNKRCVNNY